MPRTRQYEPPRTRSTDDVQTEQTSIAYSEQEAWEFVQFLSAHVASLETRAAIIIPAQVAGLFLLWTQFFTFEETVPHVLAWIAWATLVLGLIGAAWMITPGRIGKDSLIGHGLEARPGRTREELVREVCDTIQRRARLLHTGLRVSVGLTMFALGLSVLAYAVDKTVYGS